MQRGAHACSTASAMQSGYSSRPTSGPAAWSLNTAMSDDALPQPGLIRAACSCRDLHPRTETQLPGEGPERLGA